MALSFEERLQKGAGILSARREALPQEQVQPEQPQIDLEPFKSSLSFEQRLQFGQQRLEGRNDFTALQNVFGEGRTGLGEFSRGVSRGIRSLGDLGLGLGALGASAVGQEEVSQDIGRLIAERQFRTQIELAPLQEFEGAFDDPGSFVTWLAGVVGEQVPNVASIIAGGGAGTLIGKALAKRAISRQAASRAMDFTIRHSGEIGVFGAATAIETGSTTVEQLGTTGTINPLIAISAGVVKGALEGLTPLAFASTFGIVDSVLQRRFLQLIANKVDDLRARPTRALISGVRTAPLEGATELLQAAVDLAARDFTDENFDALSPEARASLLEPGVTGAFVGAVFGFGVGAIAPRRGVSLDAPLATFTDDEAGGKVKPSRGKPLPVETINEDVPFVFANEEGELIDREEGGPLEFQSGLKGFASLAVQRRGNEVTRFYKLEDEASADKSALLEDLPVDPDLIGVEAGVSFKSEATRDEALKLVQDAVLERNFVLEASAAQNVPVGNRLNPAKKLYQQALDLGFRLEPVEGDGFALVGKADLREVDYQPGLLTGSPTSPFVREGGPNPRETLVNVLPQEFPDITPLGSKAIEGISGITTGVASARKGRTVVVDVTRLPLDKMRVGSRLVFQEIVEEALPPARRLEDATEEEIREVIETMEQSGLITVPSKSALDTLIDSVVKADSLIFGDALNLGAEIRPPTSVETDISGLYYKGSSSSAEFLLASTRVPRFPSYLNQRRNDVVTYSTASDMQRRVDANYAPLTKNGKKQDLTKLKAGLTVLYAQGGRDNLNLVARNDIGGARLFALSLIRKYMRRFNFTKSHKMVVLFTDQKQNSGFAGLSKDGVALLSINVIGKRGVTLNEVQRLDLTDTVAHEFGHLIAGVELSKLKDGDISQLLNSYTRDLFRAELLPIGSTIQQYGAVPDFFSPGTLRGVESSIIEGETLARGIKTSIGFEANYLLNFDEWIANNMSKLALDPNRESITTFEKVLQRIGRLLEKHFETVVGDKKKLFKGIEDFKADLEFTKFIERIIEKRAETGSFVTQMLPGGGQQEPKYAEELNAPYEETGVTNPSRRLVAFATMSAPNVTPEQKRILDATTTASDYFNGLVKWGYTILQVARLNPNISWMQEYVTAASRWHSESTRWKARASDHIKEWTALGKQQGDALAKFFFELEHMEYLKREEIEKGQFRRPTTGELNALAKRHGLTEPAKEVYLQIAKDFDDFLNTVEEVEIRRINKELAGTPRLDAELEKSAADFRRLRAKPYFPHARFGQIAVVVKDKKGVTRYMEQVEGPLFTISNRLAEKRRRELRRRLDASEDFRTELQLEDGFAIAIVKIPEEAQPFRGLPPTLLRAIENTLELSEQQRLWLKQLIVDQSPTNSFRKRLGKRENVPGYSRDAMRAYADYMWHGSNYLARLTHGLEMQDILAGAKGELSALAAVGANLVKRRQILEYLEDHFTNIMNPGADWAQLRSAAFSWWLGFVPASAALNFTQVPMVAYPYLAARFSDRAAVGALTRGYKDVTLLSKDPDKALAKLGPEDFKQFGLADQQGFINESYATEVAAVAEGGNLERLAHGSALSRSVTKIGQAAAWMFQASEHVNRRVVFRAGIELARKSPDSEYVQELIRLRKTEFNDLVRIEGMSETEAGAFLAGKDAVLSSQFEYAAWARPRFMRGRPGVIFTFFMFVQNMTFFAIHSPGQTRYWLMLLAMAGVMGLPGAEDLVAVSQFIGRKLFGKHYDVELEVSRFVVDTFGGEVPPDLLLHGAGRFGFGLLMAADMVGIPLPTFDMSAAISMGRLIPGLSELKSPSRDFNQSFSRISTDVAGATLGIGLGFIQYMSDTELPWNDPKRFERAIPRSLRNVSKMYRFGVEGREKTRQGATVVSFDTDEFEDVGEILLTGAGFQPQRLTREWDRTAAKREAEAYWSIRRGILMKQFGMAVLARDEEAKADMLKAIKRFNDEVPFRTIRITRETLRTSLKERTRRRRLIEAGISQQKMFIPLSRDINRILPGERGGVVDVQDVSRIR